MSFSAVCESFFDSPAAGPAASEQSVAVMPASNCHVFIPISLCLILQSSVSSFYCLEISRLPRAVERRLLGPVNPEIDEPALAGNGLDPLALMTGRHLRAEVQIHG